MRWTFGEEALAQSAHYATVSRRLSSLVLAMEGESPVVADLIDAMERAEADLAGLVPADGRPRVGADHPADGRVYVDHARDIGRFNAAFPEYTIDVDGGRATGTVSFPVLYEGPPGLVHGGVLGVFFDSVIQHHNCDVGTAGKTTDLALGFTAPTPLLRELTFDIERTVDGRRITSVARLHDGGRLCATATMHAVAGDHASLPPVSSRRP